MIHRRHIVIFAFVLVVPFLVVACGGGGGEETATQKQETVSETQPIGATGSVQYTANFEGSQPERSKADASGNPECGVDTVLGEEIIVNDNQTLRDMVVSVADGPSGYEVPTKEVTIDQKNCRYRPHVTTVKAGQTVKITDSDPKMHNVRATRDGQQLFNLTTFKGDVKKVNFKNPGYVRLECNIHPWMEAWVYVTEHGKAKVTGEDGQATLENLPTGDYTLRTWHEKFKSSEHSVSVKEDQTTEIEKSYDVGS